MARLTTDEKKKITSLAEDAKKNNNTTLHFDDIFRFELNNLSKDVCCKDIASKEGEARTLYEDVFERYKPPKTVFRKIQNKLRSLVGRSSVEQSLPGRSLASRPAGSTPSVNGTNTKRSSILENSIAFATAAAKLREQKQKASSSKKGGKKTKKQKTRRSKKTKRKTRRKKN